MVVISIFVCVVFLVGLMMDMFLGPAVDAIDKVVAIVVVLAVVLIVRLEVVGFEEVDVVVVGFWIFVSLIVLIVDNVAGVVLVLLIM